MNTNRRRNLATLLFICFLAVVYLIILMLGRHPDEAPVADVDVGQVESAVDSIVPAADTLSTAAAKKKKKPSAKRRPSPPAPDLPDILDSPVPAVHR